MKRPVLPISILTMCLAGACAMGMGQNDGVHTDAVGDAAIRRTDAGNDAPLPQGFEPIDLLEVRLQGWETTTPMTDPYDGVVISGDADLMRLKIIVDGLVSPPGPIGLDASPYNPYAYGDRPLYAYIELDLDDSIETGGEFVPLARNRYLANVGRFGQSPLGAISDRMVRDAGDVDSDFGTAPQFERTGGEFTLALCGCFTPEIVSQNGDMDSIFDPGETWILRGRFFERMIAFAPESGMFGGSDFGLFDPFVEIQFCHNDIANRTTITLIYPITNEGAAMLSGEGVQPLDLSLLNQTSIAEALDDLIFGADFATGDLGTLVRDWDGRFIEDYQQPAEWGVTALIGTASTEQDPAAFFVWTDTGFDEVPGDLNNDDISDEADTMVILNTIIEEDGTSTDADGVVNDEVAIMNFGPSFDLRDLNGDGVISAEDILVPLCAADFNGDGVINFFDMSAFLSAFKNEQDDADFNGDGEYNFFDVSAFLTKFIDGCPGV
ncbi:MAG: GC-type dockerin domain-anchored protein [Phycisphaerales bacterium JB052]